MTKRTTWRATMLTATAGLALAVAGCQSDPDAKNRQADPFFPTGPRSAHQFATVQANNGARADATIQPHHFDGNELNALGRAKIDGMVAGRDGQSTTIYMNFPEAQMMEPRRDSVAAYLRTCGIDEANVKFASGPNPAPTHPAAGHLSRMERTESDGTSTMIDSMDFGGDKK